MAIPRTSSTLPEHPLIQCEARVTRLNGWSWEVEGHINTQLIMTALLLQITMEWMEILSLLCLCSAISAANIPGCTHYITGRARGLDCSGSNITSIPQLPEEEASKLTEM